MTNELPKKLKADAIVEAVLELRFVPDPDSVAEVSYGRFADTPDWESYKQVRLPAADIPAALRKVDNNLRYAPVIELVSKDGAISVRFGNEVVTYIRRGAYPGWEQFGPELEKVVTRLFTIVPKAKVSRIGMRYINALRTDLHGINSIGDLDVDVKVADADLVTSVNLNYKTDVGDNLEAMTRIASVDMAQGSVPEKASVIVDIDVYTKAGFSSTDAAEVRKYVDTAHEREKQTFFRVLGKEVTERLKEA